LLACNPFGATEAIMHVHGFTRPTLAKLVRAGLATAQSETGKAIAVGRIRITDAGRRAIEG
jgi:DNA-binding PadR family transcriptional regulator